MRWPRRRPRSRRRRPPSTGWRRSPRPNCRRTARTVVDDLRNSAEIRANAAWERLGPQGDARQETPSELYRRLRRDMLEPGADRLHQGA